MTHPPRGNDCRVVSIAAHESGTDTVAPGRARVDHGAIHVAPRPLRIQSTKILPWRRTFTVRDALGFAALMSASVSSTYLFFDTAYPFTMSFESTVAPVDLLIL